MAKLNIPQWLIDAGIETPKIEMDKFCNFLYENLSKCCSVITTIKADSLEEQLKVYFALPQICLSTTESISNIGLSNILVLMDKYITEKSAYFKELYTSYKNNNLCK